MNMEGHGSEQEGRHLVDAAKLKAAILRLRDTSRVTNDEWTWVDREMWQNISEEEE
jgi:hypothetical protein